MGAAPPARPLRERSRRRAPRTARCRLTAPAHERKVITAAKTGRDTRHKEALHV